MVSAIPEDSLQARHTLGLEGVLVSIACSALRFVARGCMSPPRSVMVALTSKKPGSVGRPSHNAAEADKRMRVDVVAACCGGVPQHAPAPRFEALVVR